jgi:DHA2 family multidrug resistance protein-like MFS transporter
VSAVAAVAAQPARATRREWVGLGVLALACLLYVMDLTVLHLAVPKISADLHPTSTQLLWIIDIYGFFVAGSLITMGALGDRIGRRRLLLSGATAFGILSILAAFSVSPEMLIFSRAALGIAGATLAPATLSLIFTMFQDPRQRSIAIGVWIGAFSAGSAVGPVLGGILLEFFWWGSVFLLALPVMAALLILGPRVLPEYKDPDAGRLDLVSAVMSIAAVLAVIFGLTEIAQNGVTTVPVVVIGAGLTVGAIWIRRQRSLADPMIDLSLFRIRSFDTALVVNFLSIFVAVGYFLYIAQYLQLVAGLSPLSAGLWSLPSAVGFVVGSQLAPRIVQRVRPAYLIGGGLLVAAVGLAILSQVRAVDGLATIVLASVVISLGLAPVFGLTTELIVGAAPPERAGAASGISETGAELGGALGIAGLGSIGLAIYRGELTQSAPAALPAATQDAARDTLGAAIALARDLPGPLGAALVDAAQQAFVDGMRTSATIAAVVAVGLAAVALVGLRSHPVSSAEGQVEVLPEALPSLALSEETTISSDSGPAQVGPRSEPITERHPQGTYVVVPGAGCCTSDPDSIAPAPTRRRHGPARATQKATNA